MRVRVEVVKSQLRSVLCVGPVLLVHTQLCHVGDAVFLAQGATSTSMESTAVVIAIIHTVSLHMERALTMFKANQSSCAKKMKTHVESQVKN